MTVIIFRYTKSFSIVELANPLNERPNPISFLPLGATVNDLAMAVIAGCWYHLCLAPLSRFISNNVAQCLTFTGVSVSVVD